MDFVVGVFLGKCKNMGIKFIQLKYRIPVSATHSKSETVCQNALDWVGYVEKILLLFEDITNLELALDILSTNFKRYHLEINISSTNTMIFNH